MIQLKATFNILYKMEFVTSSKGKTCLVFNTAVLRSLHHFLRNHPGLSQLKKCSSKQGHTGCLKVALEILERLCIEAGAHHRWDPSWTGSGQFVK